MRKTLTCAASALTALMLTAGTTLAPQDAPDQKGGAVERAGQRIDQAIKDVKKGVQGITESVQERWAHAKTAVENMGVEGRIYGRLHWDKALRDARLDIEVKDGVAILRGEVPDGAARVKAAELALDTVGVSRVDDQLTIRSPAKSDVRQPIPSSRR